MPASGISNHADREATGVDSGRRAALEGDSERFELVIQPLLSGAYGLAYSMLGQREAAEDAVQDAVTKAWRGFARLRRGTSSQAWFFTIVANQCRDARRSGRSTLVSLFDVPEPKVADHADQVMRDLDLGQALAQLPPRSRGLLFLRYQMDMSPAEIAVVLRWRVGTVKSRIHRILRKLEVAMAPAEERTR